MSSTEFTPTDQQIQAVELFLAGPDLKVQALAGAGKTSTLKLMANATDSQGRYISFNKAIATEAQAKFPANVACSTAHSLAMRAVGRRYAHRLNSSRMKPWVFAEALGLELPAVFDMPNGETKELDPMRVASIANQTVNKFCMTGDLELTERHVPFQRGLDAPGRYENMDALREMILPIAKEIWADITNVNGRFVFSHNHYLKIWHLEGPRIDADFILFDEAQDANPLMMAIVEAQSHAQRVWVGDSNQQIYSWNGAVNAMEKASAVNETWLTESFRFGPEVAEAANTVLARLGAPEPVIGSGPAGRVGPVVNPDVILSRTNASVLGSALEQMAMGRQVAVVGGTKDLEYFAEHAEKLQSGKRASHPDLACFDSWSEVQVYADSEDGADLRMIVKLVDDFGARTLIQRLRNTVDERHADVVLSTAHKSKGREWDKVALGNDFPVGDDVADEELRLIYVAATRAMLELDVSQAILTGEVAEYEDIDGRLVPVTAAAEPAESVVEVAPVSESTDEPEAAESAAAPVVTESEVESTFEQLRSQLRDLTERDVEVEEMREMLGDRPLGVSCVYCGAVPFRACRTVTSDRPTAFHVGRLEAARDMILGVDG